MALIETRGLTKVYKMGNLEVKVLLGIDLSIEQGEFVAIMGPSGSGKSTYMNIFRLSGQTDYGRVCPRDGGCLPPHRQPTCRHS